MHAFRSPFASRRARLNRFLLYLAVVVIRTGFLYIVLNFLQVSKSWTTPPPFIYWYLCQTLFFGGAAGYISERTDRRQLRVRGWQGRRCSAHLEFDLIHEQRG